MRKIVNLILRRSWRRSKTSSFRAISSGQDPRVTAPLPFCKQLCHKRLVLRSRAQRPPRISTGWWSWKKKHRRRSAQSSRTVSSQSKMAGIAVDSPHRVKISSRVRWGRTITRVTILYSRSASLPTRVARTRRHWPNKLKRCRNRWSLLKRKPVSWETEMRS